MIDGLQLSVTRPELAFAIDFVRHVEPAVWLYLAAAVLARFWHTRMWWVYVAFAVLAILAPHFVVFSSATPRLCECFQAAPP